MIYKLESKYATIFSMPWREHSFASARGSLVRAGSLPGGSPEKILRKKDAAAH